MMATTGITGVQGGPQRNGVNGTEHADEKKGDPPWDREVYPNPLAHAKIYGRMMMAGSTSSTKSESRH
jgi:hypothetical protein